MALSSAGLVLLVACGGGSGPSPSPGPQPPGGTEPPPAGGTPGSGGTPPGAGSAPFDEAGFLADLVSRPIPVDAPPAAVRAGCGSRTVNGPGNEAFSGPVPCLGGFCIENTPAASWLWTVAGASSSTLWAVGEGVLLRHDGARWDTACAPLDGWMLYAAHAASDRDAWVAGAGTLAHFDGSTWTATAGDPSWSVLDVWGDAREAFARSSSGVQRWDGARWAPSYAPPYASPLAVWGDGAGRAWVVDGGTLATWNGAAWSPAERPFNLNDVWAPRGGAPWFAGFTFRDPEWWIHDAAVCNGPEGACARSAFPTGYFEARWVRGSSASDVWVGTSGDAYQTVGPVFRWDGASWNAVPPPSTGELFRPPLVLGPGDAWMVANTSSSAQAQTLGRVLRFDGSQWAESLVVTGSGIASVITSRDAVWAAGDDGLWRRDAARWTRLHESLGYAPLLATDGEGVWAAGLEAAAATTLVVRWDGSRMTESRLPGNVAAIHAAGGHAWVATSGDTGEGVNAVVHHFDGGSWSALDTGTTMTVNDVWASAPDDLWVVGAVHPTSWTSITGVIAHWDGARWVGRELRDQDLRAVWGSSRADVWVSGDAWSCQKCPAVAPDPLLLRWDGARLAKVASVAFQEITGTGASEVWATAWGPAPSSPYPPLFLYRFDGARWSAIARLDVPFRPTRLFVAADGTLWGVDGGRMLRRSRAP